MLNYHLSTGTHSKAIMYWIVTGLVATESMLGGVWDIWRSPYVRTDMVHLGYPLYTLTILGVWKLLGTVVILIPRFPRLKEWAYAGMFFDSTLAVMSHLAKGDNFLQHAAYPLFVAILVLVSWALRPVSRRELALNK